jgi:peptide/nickel transport system ATP-binding protein
VGADSFAMVGDLADTRTGLCEVRNLKTVIDGRAGAVCAVDNVSFSISPGETLGLVGESGSGKTMTALSLMRLLPPGGRISGGSIRFGDVDLAAAPMSVMRSVRGAQIGMVFQDPMTSLDPTMTVGRQVAEAWRVHNDDGTSRQAREAALEALDLVGIPRPNERFGSFPHQLSGGLRQRVMIAMALVCRPKLLIADEPTTALDVTIQAQILRLLDDLKSRLNMAVLLVTHDMGVVANHADRVAVMYAGEIVEIAPTDELIRGARHRYSRALLDSIPKLSQDRSSRLRAIPGLPPDLSTPLAGCRFAPRCRHADDTCRTSMPAASGDDEHWFSCFHPTATIEQQTAPTLAPVAIPTLPSVGDPLLSCKDLVKHFSPSGLFGAKGGSPIQAVAGVSLDIAPGETFGLVGESGCGKTTLGHMIVGLEAPTSGSVVYAGADLHTLRGRELKYARRDLQLMFQDPYSSLDPRMKVKAIVAEPLAAQRIGNRLSRRTRVAELLDQVGLPASAGERYPHEFSGGQRQRIGLARSLALAPKLIVADEPVSALDVSIRSQILNLMRDLQDSSGLSYLIISHDLSVVRYMADRVGVMYLGKLVEVAPAASLYAHPTHPYTAGLLASIPDPEMTASGPTRGIGGELPSASAPPSGCRYRTRCSLAQDICASQEPPLEHTLDGHLVACYFPLRPKAPLEVGPRPASVGSATEPDRSQPQL